MLPGKTFNCTKKSPCTSGEHTNLNVLQLNYCKNLLSNIIYKQKVLEKIELSTLSLNYTVNEDGNLIFLTEVSASSSDFKSHCRVYS